MNKQYEWDSFKYKEKTALMSLFTEEALKDENWNIRIRAYRSLGFTEEALKNEYWLIRLEAYRSLGFTEQALKDECYDIRNYAAIYLDYIKKLTK